MNRRQWDAGQKHISDQRWADGARQVAAHEQWLEEQEEYARADARRGVLNHPAGPR